MGCWTLHKIIRERRAIGDPRSPYDAASGVTMRKVYQLLPTPLAASPASRWTKGRVLDSDAARDQLEADPGGDD